MPIGRSREEQELNARLVEGLVAREVLGPMDKIGWGHGAPPPPESGLPAPPEGAPGSAAAPAPAKPGGQPAPAASAAPAPTDKPKADTPKFEDLVAGYEALRDPETGLIARKYRTVEDAIKGGVHLTQMTKQSFSERDEALRKLAEAVAENERLRQTSVPAPAGTVLQPTHPAPSQARRDAAQAKLDGVLSRINENGGVFDGETSKAFAEANRELAEATTDVRMEENQQTQKNRENADNAVWKQIDEYMSKKYPAAERFSEEVATYLTSDPLLNSAVQALYAQGKRLEATELAWVSFAKAHGDQISAEDRAKAEEVETDLAAREQVRKEAVEKARRDAGVVTGSAGGAGAHENRNAAGASREEVQAAAEAMRREGDAPGTPSAAHWRRMVIPLDPAIFGPQ